jgi:hypothetical protein
VVVGVRVGVSGRVDAGVSICVYIVVRIGMGVLRGVGIKFDSQAERNTFDRINKRIVR